MKCFRMLWAAFFFIFLCVPMKGFAAKRNLRGEGQSAGHLLLRTMMSSLSTLISFDQTNSTSPVYLRGAMNVLPDLGIQPSNVVPLSDLELDSRSPFNESHVDESQPPSFCRDQWSYCRSSHGLNNRGEFVAGHGKMNSAVIAFDFDPYCPHEECVFVKSEEIETDPVRCNRENKPCVYTRSIYARSTEGHGGDYQIFRYFEGGRAAGWALQRGEVWSSPQFGWNGYGFCAVNIKLQEPLDRPLKKDLPIALIAVKIGDLPLHIERTIILDDLVRNNDHNLYVRFEVPFRTKKDYEMQLLLIALYPIDVTVGSPWLSIPKM